MLSDDREAAFRARDWLRYLESHFGRDRICAFRRVAPNLSDSQYWSLLGTVLIHVERPGPDMHDLLRSDRPERSAIMTASELRIFNDLPAEMTVWRGDTYTDDPGWSWTLDRNVAEWFARQRERVYGGQARLGAATCFKTEAIGYLSRREEAEILFVLRTLLQCA